MILPTLAIDVLPFVAGMPGGGGRALGLLGGGSGGGPDWAVLGRLHPLVVHFPIALVLVAAATEAWRRLRRPGAGPSPAGLAMVLWAVPATALAAALGWGNAEADFAGRDLARVLGTLPDVPDAGLDRLLAHRLLALAVLAAVPVAAVTGVLARRAAARPGSDPRGTGTYRAVLASAAIAVAVTGHLGGALVRGPGWTLGVLQRGFAGPPAQGAVPTAGPAVDPGPRSPEEPGRDGDEPAAGDAVEDPAGGGVDTDGDPGGDDPAFGTPELRAELRTDPEDDEVRRRALARTVSSILTASCLDCHDRTGSAGGLAMESLADLFAGEPRWWTVTPGDPGASELLRRVRLAEDDPLRMPPRDPFADGEASGGLPAVAIAALEAWIAAGAPLEDGSRPE